MKCLWFSKTVATLWPSVETQSARVYSALARFAAGADQTGRGLPSERVAGSGASKAGESYWASHAVAAAPADVAVQVGAGWAS